ncbi:MAG: hypothetical protein KKG35_03095 [Proteobacteria bacterium]|nr:hypothetical protein [Pseudomonadota bacterium]
MRSGIAIILTACLLLGSSFVKADALRTYRGFLFSQSGQPVNSTVSMTFRIYDVSVGGTPIWNVTKNIQILDGMFEVQLGDKQPLNDSIFENDELYIGIQVGIDDEMTPRKQMSSEGYVFKTKY